MERLPASDFAAMLPFVRQLQAAQDLDRFSRSVLRGLRPLVGADNAGYNDVDFEAQRATWVDDPVGVSRFPGCDEILSRHLFENPLAAHYAKGPDDRCLKISDFVSLRAFQRTTVYNEFYQRIETNYQFGLVSHGRTSSATAIVLHRQRSDFRERDRTLLTLLRPHVVQGYRNARRVTELHADIASITSGVDSARVGLIVLGEDRDIRIATARARRLLSTYFEVAPRMTDTLPPVLDAWVRRHETSARDHEVPTPRTPYVVDRDDRRLVIRLIGEHPRRLLAFSEQRLGVDRQALETLGLTRREAEVLTWLAEGKRDQEIALILAISPRTVQHHLAHIYDRLGVETRNAAVAAALRASSDSLTS